MAGTEQTGKKIQTAQKNNGLKGRYFTSPITALAKYVSGLIYPELCIFCRRPVERGLDYAYICKECLKDLPLLEFDPCLRHPECPENMEIRGLGIFRYESIRETIFLFKYHGFRKYGDILGGLMAEHIIKNDMQALLTADVIMPVPLWREKETARGFNQAALMAEKVSEATGIPMERDALIRIRNTAPQSSLGLRQRRENIRSAFKVTDEDKVRGRRIILLDDIYTTGSTIKECAKNLYAMGAREVMFIALASGGTWKD